LEGSGRDTLRYYSGIRWGLRKPVGVVSNSRCSLGRHSNQNLTYISLERYTYTNLLGIKNLHNKQPKEFQLFNILHLNNQARCVDVSGNKNIKYFYFPSTVFFLYSYCISLMKNISLLLSSEGWVCANNTCSTD
jgi:hypothetical protein